MRAGILFTGTFLLLLSAPPLSGARTALAAATDVCASGAAGLASLRDPQADAFTQAYLSSRGHGGLYFSGDSCAWSCSASSAEEPRAACLSNLFQALDYSCADWLKQFGFDVTDDQYLAEAGAKFGGKLLTVPPELVAAAVGGATIDGLKRVLEQHQWKYLEYDSTSVNNVPDGFGRILILIEGDAYDQWVQIAVNAGPPRRLGRNIDFIAVDKKDEATLQPLETPIVYFRGFSRGQTGFDPKGHGTPHALTRCYACHPGGLRRVVPKPGSYPPDSENVVSYFRDRVDNLTPAGFGPHYRPEKYGPPLGPVDPPGRLERISAGCARGIPEARRPAVAQAMSCASCHDGSYRGLLNAGTDSATLRHKIVENAIAPMPPGNSLSPAERSILFDCVREEYAAQLGAWLKERPCP